MCFAFFFFNLEPEKEGEKNTRDVFVFIPETVVIFSFSSLLLFLCLVCEFHASEFLQQKKNLTDALQIETCGNAIFLISIFLKL